MKSFLSTLTLLGLFSLVISPEPTPDDNKCVQVEDSTFEQKVCYDKKASFEDKAYNCCWYKATNKQGQTVYGCSRIGDTLEAMKIYKNDATKSGGKVDISCNSQYDDDILCFQQQSSTAIDKTECNAYSDLLKDKKHKCCWNKATSKERDTYGCSKIGDTLEAMKIYKNEITKDGAKADISCNSQYDDDIMCFKQQSSTAIDKTECNEYSEKFKDKENKCCLVQTKKTAETIMECKRIKNTEKDIKNIITGIEEQGFKGDIQCGANRLMLGASLVMIVMSLL